MKAYHFFYLALVGGVFLSAIWMAINLSSCQKEEVIPIQLEEEIFCGFIPPLEMRAASVEIVDILLVVATTDDGTSLINGEDGLEYLEEAEAFWDYHFPTDYNITVMNLSGDGFIPVDYGAVTWLHYNLLLPNNIDPNNYDKVIILCPAKAYPWAGLSGSGSFSYMILLSSGMATYNVARVASHELGHSYGLYHSRRQLYRNCAFLPAIVYGGDDVMGNTTFYTLNPYNLARLDSYGSLSFTPTDVNLLMGEDTVVWIPSISTFQAIQFEPNRYLYCRPEINTGVIQYTENEYRRETIKYIHGQIKLQPVSITLSGSLTNAADVEIVVCGETILHKESYTTMDGNLQVPIPIGVDVSLFVSVPNYLSVVVEANSDQTVTNVILRPGDMNNDRIIDQTDISTWQTNPVDLNQDGMADGCDLQMINVNQMLTGDSAPCSPYVTNSPHYEIVVGNRAFDYPNGQGDAVRVYIKRVESCQ